MKKICVITATRAEYGLLYWLMKKIKDSNKLELQLLVTGMHLSEKFGSTWKQIEQDGFDITAKVDLGRLEDSIESVAYQTGTATIEFQKAFTKNKPDLVVILGDRYEMLGVATAALINQIPICHIHGGEITEGAFDDPIRHSLTKMSFIHFTTTDVYRNRVIQMGEDPSKVFNFGAPGLENFGKLQLLSKKKLSENLKFELAQKVMLITYHPVTATQENGIDDLIEALSEYEDISQIITLPNSDPGHDDIFKKLKTYAEKNLNVYLTRSLGQILYLSIMKICDVVIGNSSSGIIEAPFAGVPTVNIGKRQEGRVCPKTVISVEPEKNDIKLAINEALNSFWDRSFVYGHGEFSNHAVEILEELDLNAKSRFHDIGIDNDL